MNTPNIETNQTVIKLIDMGHVPLLCQYYIRNKSHLKSWEPQRDKTFYTKEYWLHQSSEALILFKKRLAVKLVAFDKSESQIIASCNFNNIVMGCFHACHLGYSIDKNYEGKNLMYEVIDASINYIHKEFNLHRIMANHLPNNIRSEKLLSKLGFEKEGYAKEYLKINGKWQDHILNSLILPSR